MAGYVIIRTYASYPETARSIRQVHLRLARACADKVS